EPVRQHVDLLAHRGAVLRHLGQLIFDDRYLPDDFVERETAFHYGPGKIIQLFERTSHAMGETRIDLRLAVTGPACEPVEQPAEKSAAASLLAQMVTHHTDAVGEVHHEFFRKARQGIAQR